MPFAVLPLESRSLVVCVAALSQCCALAACTVYDEDRVARQPTAAAQAGPGAAGSGAPDVAGSTPTASAAPSVVVMCEPLASPDPCARLPHLTHSPLIDGVAECGVSLSALPNSALPERSVRYAAAWSDSGLYLYAAVSGPRVPHAPEQPLFCGDALELFVDADGVLDPQGAYDASGTLQFVIAAPSDGAAAIEAGKFMSGKPFGSWVSDKLAVKVTEDGYAVEALIGGADLGVWGWRPSGRVGLDLAVDFAAAGPANDPVCATARTQLLLKASDGPAPCNGQPWCDARAFCAPDLGD